ncbi:hypothetical protein F2Q68_00005538 [Brassica cretica]|uniref:Protein kinase domain-containing protein n=1 Tax=Brassica cretica TaxID=69181 RepID=A0A8S9JKC6_BRACR|nr:hypothetical protein F2Q68_00005538 [Brassica cretica]
MRMAEDGRSMISTIHTGGSTSHAMSKPSPDDAFIRKSDIEALIKALNANSAAPVVETVHPDPEGGGNEPESQPQKGDDSASTHDQDGDESDQSSEDHVNGDQGHEEAVRPSHVRARSLRSDRASGRARSLRSDRALVRVRLLRSDRAVYVLGRYVATELRSSFSNTNAGDSSSPGKGGSKAPVIIGIAVMVAVLFFLAILGFVVFIMKKKYGMFRRTTDPENPWKVLVSDAASNGNGNGNGHGANNFNSLNSGDNTSELLLLEGGSVTIPMEVLRQVTNNFSEANILGRGGFGTVYFGELLDGTKVAMKRMEFSAMNKQGTNEFQAEIVVLTKVRHKHVVSLSWVTV